jgi:UDP-N-acetylmuramoyl-tripeptide--D-alanyl-D-alanine ligase
MAWQYTVDEVARMIGAPPPGNDTPCAGVSTDTRTLQPGHVFFALSGEHFDGNRFVADAFAKGAAAVVTTAPNDAGPCLLVDTPLTALQQFARRHRERHPIPLLAITGSCGKTTSKDAIAAVLGAKYRVLKTQGNLNNDIGCPLSLLRIDEATEMAVIEMGASHLCEIAQLCRIARPTEAAITMVGPSHLEGFGSIERVAQAKAEIMEALDASGRFYINTDDPRCVAIGERFAGEKVRFGQSGDVALRHWAFDEHGEMVLDIDPIGRLRLPLLVRAQVRNFLLAIAVGLQYGITGFEEPLRAACRNAVRCRIERVGPIEVLDDTYNANPASMKAALEALSDRPAAGRRIAALGGMLELGEAAESLHGEVGAYAVRCGVTCLFARGPEAHAMILAAQEAGIPHAEVLDEHAAMAAAIHAIVRPGDVLLLKGSRGMRMERVLAALRGLYELTT